MFNTYAPNPMGNAPAQQPVMAPERRAQMAQALASPAPQAAAMPDFGAMANLMRMHQQNQQANPNGQVGGQGIGMPQNGINPQFQGMQPPQGMQDMRQNMQSNMGGQGFKMPNQFRG